MILEYVPTLPGEGHTAGRQLLSQMYQAYTGKKMPKILVTDRGKPYFFEGDLHFSISHTRHYVFCALSDAPIGLDAEEETREIDLRLAEKILSPSEKTQYERAADKRTALLTFWVLKEAQAKFTGVGLNGYPRQTNFCLDDPRVRKIANCLVAVIE